MNIIKLILALLGIALGIWVLFWVIGVVYSAIWYLFWIGLLGAVGYGGYKLFRKAEDKALGAGPAAGYMDSTRDIDLSWEEYERKYLSK